MRQGNTPIRDQRANKEQESSCRNSHILKKDKGKRKQNKACTTIGSTGSEECEEKDNHSEHFRYQSENLEHEGNPHAAFMENFSSMLWS